MSRRRSRYTVTYSPHDSNEVVRGVALAYSPEGAAGLYDRRGTVLEVERGDYRRKARATARTTAPGAGQYTIDRAALAEAIDLLGIKWPVKLTTNSRVGATQGNHSLIYSGGTCRHVGNRVRALDTATDVAHRVMVKTYLTAAEASRVLWHELAHAMQAEREAADAGAVTMREVHAAWSTCSARGRGVSYNRKPIEVEASEYEAFADDLPIAR